MRISPSFVLHSRNYKDFAFLKDSILLQKAEPIFFIYLLLLLLVQFIVLILANRRALFYLGQASQRFITNNCTMRI